MGNLFRKSPKRPASTEEQPVQKSRVTEQDKAVLQLKQQRDKIHQYQKKLEKNMSRDREIARSLLSSGKKDKALLLLRKKKYQEGQLLKFDGQLENIEQLIGDIEYAQIESQVVQGLQSGNEALKTIHRMFSLEDVERIMDETADSVEYQRQIDEMISMGGGLSTADEDDVLDELEAILADQGEPAAERDLSLPDVPTTDLPEKAKQKRVVALAQ